MARRAGAVVHGASPVTGLAQGRGAVTSLRRRPAMVKSGTVVLATNGYGPEHLHPVLRQPAAAGAFEHRRHEAHDRRREVGLQSGDDRCDVRYPDDAELLSAAARRPPAARQPWTGDRRPEPSWRRTRTVLLDNLKRKFPPLENITAEYFWGGWVAISRDSMPHVHHAEDDASIHYALGYCGSGVSAALHAGRRLAERIAGRGRGFRVLDYAAAAHPLRRLPAAGAARCSSNGSAIATSGAEPAARRL